MQPAMRDQKKNTPNHNSIRIAVQMSYPWKKIPFQDTMRSWIIKVFETENQYAAAITLYLTNIQGSQKLNFEFCGKNKPTNVLAFLIEAQSNYIMGDLILCVPLIKKEAREQHKSSAFHFAHLIVHGGLHLLGYDHGTPRQAKKMEKREIEILRQLAFPNPYQT